MQRKKTEKTKKKNLQGFTLIELLLSMAIISILTGASLVVARFADTQKNLTLSANQLRALIRSAQTYALAVPFSSEEHICGFGVYFTNENTAQLFYTKATDSEFNLDATTACDAHLEADGFNLLEKVVLSANSSSWGEDQDIFFRVPYGRVYSNGVHDRGIIYSLTSNEATKTVVINRAGKVE